MVGLRIPSLALIAYGVFGVATGREGEGGNAESSASLSSSLSKRATTMDESWPIQSIEGFLESTTNNAQRKHYTAYMNGCAEFFGQDLCQKNEKERLARNARQPAAMKNLTTLGYIKVQTPAATHEILANHLETFQHNLDSEDWGTQTSLNHWEAPVDVHDIQLFLSLEDRQIIQNEVQAELEKWAATLVTPISMYGIRVYRKGAILPPHVDRLPLVLSAIINVEQEEEGDEEWPLEVIGHDGKAVNLTLQAGEMILYESHSVIHGRPYPLEKWYYANVFLHFEPLGYSYELNQDWQKAADQPTMMEKRQDAARDAFHKALEKHKQQMNRKSTMAYNDEFPYYVTPDSDQELRWKQEFIFQREPRKPFKPTHTAGSTAAHTVAASGDLETLKEVVDRDPSVLNKADVNGWKPIHEAARGGQTKVLEYLIEKGVDVNERTHHGKGASALWWAERNFSPNHPAVQLLKKNGGVSLPPRDDY